MITLHHDLLIGTGTLRACYHYPDKSELVIKVPLAGRAEGTDANEKEWRSYHHFSRSHPGIQHISHCRGFVDTDRGTGLVCDCIRDADGGVSSTLWDIVVHREACDIDDLVRVADDLCTYLVTHDIFLFDINLKNIVYQVQPDTTCRPYVIDLKGPYDNKEFLQLSSRIRFLGRRKLKRRARQLLERIVQFREQRESLKEIDSPARR